MRKIVMLLFLVPYFFYSQQEFSVQGTVYLDSIPVEAAVVSIVTANKETSKITNVLGKFEFIIPSGKPTDSILVETSYFGAKPSKLYAKLIKNPTIINIYLNEKIELLDDIVVIAQQQIVTKPNKLIYTIKKDDYIKNSPVLDVFNNIPAVNYQPFSGIKINGIQEATVFIDGIESNFRELEALLAEDVAKIEVITSPSARYNSEGKDAIVNMITKKREESFYKVDISVSTGTINNWFSTFPMVSFKTKNLLIKSIFNYNQDTQKITTDLSRYSPDENYFQTNYREPDATKTYGSVSLKYDFSENQNLFVRATYYSYGFKGRSVGSYGALTPNEVLFTNYSESAYSNWISDMVFEQKINKNSLFIKGKVNIYDKNDFFDITEETVENSNETTSKMNEFSSEITYEMPDLKLFKQDSEIIFGSKYIYRQFNTLNNTNYELNQNIFGLYTDINSSITKKLDYFVSLYLERTNNSNERLNKNYTYFLPTVTIQQKLGKEANLAFSYARKIRRPNVYDLNTAPVYLNPGVINKGNADLLPQTDNLYALTYSKSSKGNYVSIRGFYNNVNDAILENTYLENDILVYTKENIGTVKKYGMTVSGKTRLSKTINFNTTVGFSYNKFTDENNLHNSGMTFIGSISLSSKIKNKVLISLSGDYNGPNYDFISKTTLYPYTYFNVSSNFFKDKVTVRVSYRDMFNLSSKRKNIIDNDDIYQIFQTNNITTNVILKVSYNFGKTFNDRIKSNSIQNDDLRE